MSAKNLGPYLVPSKKSEGGANPRSPTPSGFVRGGEQKNREAFAQSSITTRRRVDPDNAHTANYNTQFVFDHTEEKAVVPSGVTKGLSRNNQSAPTTMNNGGCPAMALPHIVVGAGEDDKGNY